MNIYRIEHRRDLCQHEIFGKDGKSYTGHGTYTGCPNKDNTPNFGLCGGPPKSIMQHERCAVTMEQFRRWIGPSYVCRFTTTHCEGRFVCYHCPTSYKLHVDSAWVIVVYEIADSGEGRDWREDRDQIIFNPAFAVLVSSLTLSEFEETLDFELVGNL